MTIREYLIKHPKLNTPEWWLKVKMQSGEHINEDSTLTNYMVYMDEPFWKVEMLYDIAYNKFGDMVDTTFHWMVETDYDEELSEELENELYNKTTDMLNKKTNDIVKRNKFGVPYHEYELSLNDGTFKTVDVGCEEDWGNIQQMFRDDGFGKYVECVGWGNDSDGHIEIISVYDFEADKVISPIEWAHNCVWNYADNYST